MIKEVSHNLFFLVVKFCTVKKKMVTFEQACQLYTNFEA